LDKGSNETGGGVSETSNEANRMKWRETDRRRGGGRGGRREGRECVEGK
jgi:hypothetical protein